MNDDLNEEMDARQEAAHRLAMVGVVQMHQLRRTMMGGRRAAWQDPSQGQGRVLALLKLQPETTQKDLTFLLGMSRQALAELLGKLEKQGLIEREPSPDDRRVVIVRLTEAGRSAEQTKVDRQGAGHEELLDVLDDEEVAQLSAYLGRILEHAQERFAGALGERREAFEEMWRARRGFDPRMRGGRPWFGPFGGFGGPGGFEGRPGPRGPGGPCGPQHPHGESEGTSA